MKKLFLKAAFITGSVLLLSSCKMILKHSDGGTVVSASGSNDCATSSCEIEIPTEGFTDTFTAMPDSGYRFVNWTGWGPCTTEPECAVVIPTVPEQLSALEFQLLATFEIDTSITYDCADSPELNASISAGGEFEQFVDTGSIKFRAFVTTVAYQGDGAGFFSIDSNSIIDNRIASGVSGQQVAATFDVKASSDTPPGSYCGEFVITRTGSSNGSHVDYVGVRIIVSG